MINFIDFEEFHSVFRQALWDILREYRIPEKMIWLIKALYLGFECEVLNERKTSNYFFVETCVKQDCLFFSGLLFLLLIDWLMKVTSGKVTGAKWIDGEKLEAVDYADDFAALVSDDVKDVQEKMARLARRARGARLNVNVKKTQVM